MIDTDEFQSMFFDECDELLEGLATGLRRMEDPAHDMEIVHAVFRAVHSIKGGAAAFGLESLVTFAHRFETVLDLIRSDRLTADQAVMPVMHRSSDLLADLVTCARNGGAHDESQYDELLESLDKLMGSEGDDDAPLTFSALTISLDDFGDSPEGAGLLIEFTPKPELVRSGNDAISLLKSLHKLGEMEITIDTATVPDLTEWSADECYLRWQIKTMSQVQEDEIRELFEFVDDCCELSITPFEALENESEAEDIPPQTPLDLDPPAKPVIAQEAPPPTPSATSPSQDTSQAAATIRVSLDRVDRLMNMIGELVIKEAMLTQVIKTAGMAEDLDVVAGLDAIRQLAGDIQESVMAIRAQPLKLVFQRMHRIVREAAVSTGKQVTLVTIGEDTEVDKTMIERLIDPLTHMIRNSVDHGLEVPDRRIEAGKSLEGIITLSAAHRSGRVQIEVMDDGGGIDRAKVQQIAVEKGLIADDAILSPAEIDQLLFLPGFSSKQEVSALSGRGVGLDVVRREILDLGGRVTIASQEGEGTTFSIALPLTLAVLEGMLIQLENQTMVLPLTAVQETLRPNPSTIHGIGHGGRLLSNRGVLVPILDLAVTFGLRDQDASLDEGVLIVVETDGGKSAALLVDAIHDQRQVVIKSIEENYGRVPGVSAATILGDGQIALIIDPEEIIRAAASDHCAPTFALAANG